MWLERIIEAKKSQNITTKTMASRANLPEDTIARILSGKTKDPRLETVMRLGAAVGLNAWEVFAETGTVVSNKNIAELETELETARTTVAALTAEADRLASENMMLNAELAAIRGTVTSLQSEADLLRLKLEHKDELISLHNFYKTVIGNMRQQ